MRESFRLKTEHLSNDTEVFITDEHCFGTDAMLLAYFAEHKKTDKICDLGTGCGIIPLIMARDVSGMIYAVDIQPQATELLNMSIGESGISNIVPVCADLRDLGNRVPPGEMTLVTCNPPYKAADCGIKNETSAKRIARHEVMCTVGDVCNAASKLLQFGGRFCLCNRPERLSDVITAMKSANIEPKRLRFISKEPKKAPWLFLLEGRKGSKPFMKVLPEFYTHAPNACDDGLRFALL
jgi:tRNA1(Val) A37 N6-methylase TrmN6